MEEENHERKVLRNKMVSFMYLIFIVLAFIYIPSDFVDTIKDIDTSLSLSSKEINSAKNYNLLLVKAGLATDTLNKLNTSGTNFQRISKLTDSISNELEIVRQQVLSVSGGLNNYGYLKNAKDNQFTDKIMLEDGMATKIRSMLIDYKTHVAQSGSSIKQTTLDSILSTSEKIKTSKGKDIEWEKFYFYKMPLTVSVALISKFQNDIKAIESMAMDEYLKKLQQKYNLELVDKDIPKPQVKPIEENKPEKISPEAFVRGDDYNTLYKDVNNALAVFHPNVGIENISLTASNGQVLKKNNVFYLRVKDEGAVEINAYSAGSKNLIITQKFNVKSIPDPSIFVADRKGGRIGYKIMRIQKNMDVKNEFFKNLVDYSVKEFSLIRISAASEMSKSMKNKGAYFNSATKELIDKATKGDIYIFDAIDIETPYATTIRVSPVIFTVN